ncbi:MAG TPA: tRNA pseudouridine(13) synthase TruD [Planctomycetaceae bacterium]|nr:tRNA pseudouridine(13) synthase TruD [Planctomycetaceae bacterium]
MKLKCRPEDFRVTEQIRRQTGHGEYSLYRLTKTGFTTPDAVQRICRQWNLAPRQCRHAGLKDRHACTVQHLTIARGPEADLHTESIHLEFLGGTDSHLDAADIEANSFEVVVRSLTLGECDEIQSVLPIAAETGYPNYFDEQRFGSLGPSREYVCQAWCRRDYERALWLTFAEHNVHDDAEERNQKQLTRDLWGDWDDLKAQLDRSHRRSVVTYLVDHPTGFKKAFALVSPDLRGILLSAFQSAVWNRMLGLAFRDRSSSATIEIADAVLPFAPGNIPSVALIPLPSVRAKGLSPELKGLYESALQPYEMKPGEMKISFPRDRWFSRARRETMVVPQNLRAVVDTDDLYSGRQKMTLSFDLPRGCYATMLIRFLTESLHGD